MKMTKFDRDFVARTRQLLFRIEGDNPDFEYNVTLLLNCLLGLLTLPIERKKDHTSPTSVAFQKTSIAKLHNLGVLIHNPQSLPDDKVFRKIRNAIAHLNIEIGDDPAPDINKIILKDHNLEVEFTFAQLKDFALAVSELYLDSYFPNELSSVTLSQGN